MGYESNRQIRGGKTMSKFVFFSVARLVLVLLYSTLNSGVSVLPLVLMVV